MMFDFLERFAWLLWGFGGLIAVCIFIGLRTSGWIGERLTAFLTGFSRQRFEKPQPLIGMAASKAMRGEVKEAAADFEDMLLEHPENAELYLRLMELAYGPLQDHTYGDKILERGLKSVQGRNERASLQRLGQALKEGKLITHKHLGWMSNLEQGIQPPLLHLGDAAVICGAKRK